MAAVEYRSIQIRFIKFAGGEDSTYLISIAELPGDDHVAAGAITLNPNSLDQLMFFLKNFLGFQVKKIMPEGM